MIPIKHMFVKDYHSLIASIIPELETATPAPVVSELSRQRSKGRQIEKHASEGKTEGDKNNAADEKTRAQTLSLSRFAADAAFLHLYFGMISKKQLKYGL